MPKKPKTVATKDKKPRRFLSLSFLIVIFMLIVVGSCVYQFVSTRDVSAGGSQEGKQLLESRESSYNNIYVYRIKDYAVLSFGYNQREYFESVYNTKDDLDLPVAYTQFMSAGLMYAKNIKSILIIGFGGGRTDWYLHRSLPDVSVTSVELDPVVIEMAQKYFGIMEEPNFHISSRDGRIFLANSKDHYDMIIIDAYRGPFVPFHLLTREFYQLVRDHLADGGVVVQNVEPSTMLFDSAVRTINSVFPQLDFYPAEQNAIVVAYDGAPKTVDDLRFRADALQKEYNLRYDPHVLLQKRQPASSNTEAIDPNAKILTDDFAPVESLKVIEQHNRKWSDQQPEK